MSRVDTSGTVNVLEQKIKDLQCQLNDIFDQIDELQDKNDELTKEKNEIKEKIKRINSSNKYQAIESQILGKEIDSVQNCTEIDENEVDLNDEHLQFIKEKMNQNTKLKEELDRLTMELETEEEMADASVQINRNTQLAIAKNKQKAEKVLRETHNMNLSIENYKTQIHLQQNRTSVIQRKINECQKQIQEIISAHDILIEKSSSQKELDKKIKSLNEQKTLLEEKATALAIEDKNQAMKFEIENEELMKDGSRAKKVLGWEIEEESLKAELNKVKEESSSSKTQLDNLMKENEILRKRLSKIQPLCKKWGAEFRGAELVDIDDNIDKLLAKAINRTKNQTNRSDNNSKILSELKRSNAATEARIAKRHEDLDRMMAMFAIEQAEKKKKISEAHEVASTKEDQLIREIKALELAKTTKLNAKRTRTLRA